MAATRRTLLLAVTLAGLAIVGTTCWWRSFGPLRFDAGRWHESGLAVSGADRDRLRMAASLVASRELIGLPGVDVTRQLGTPADAVRTGFPATSMVYRLGPADTYMPIDPAFLELRMDAGGRVTEARIVTG